MRPRAFELTRRAQDSCSILGSVWCARRTEASSSWRVGETCGRNHPSTARHRHEPTGTGGLHRRRSTLPRSRKPKRRPSLRSVQRAPSPAASPHEEQFSYRQLSRAAQARARRLARPVTSVLVGRARRPRTCTAGYAIIVIAQIGSNRDTGGRTLRKGAPATHSCGPSTLRTKHAL